MTALEKVTHDSLSADFQKYNQKMRQYFYNMKVSNTVFVVLMFMQMDQLYFR